jgi:hypothetical protein
VVIRHRKPTELVDPRLRSFVRSDWAQPGDGRFDPLRRWVAARKAWVSARPNSEALGNRLEQIRAEYQAQHSREHYPPDATDWG